MKKRKRHKEKKAYLAQLMINLKKQNKKFKRK